MRNNINNALNNGNKQLSKTNFLKIFGYEYYKKILNIKFLLKRLVIYEKNVYIERKIKLYLYYLYY